MTVPSRPRLQRACEALAGRDPALAAAHDAIGVPVWRSGVANYAMLARMIAHQQVSTRSAQAIWVRVEAFLGEITAERVLACDQEALRACGLSRPKLAHLNSVAEAMAGGSLDLERICASDLEAGRRELLAVRGIGPWTADLFLLSAVGNMDAFPHGDVALIETHRRLGGYDTRMTIKEFSAHADLWRPWRGVAAHLLWGWLNAERARAGIPPA